MAIAIRKPEFHADTGIRKVGLAAHKIVREGEAVKVIFTNKKRNGEWLEPHPFYIAKRDTEYFEKRVYKGITLVMIPLHKLRQALDEWVTEEDIARAQH